MYQDVEYNGIRGSSIKIIAKERPTIPAAIVRKEEIVIPGRDGTLYKTGGGYESTRITVQFNYIGEEEKWAARWRAAQKWLAATNCPLRFSDDDGYFFWISHVELEGAERTTARIGNFEADFVTRDGLHYLNSGLREYEARELSWNPYEVSHPTYKILGEGLCTLQVNGKKMTANVGQNLTIDTDRMISYRQDGSLQNTEVTGEYEDLYLKNGENEILISYGFNLKVIPNWRCR